MVLYVPSMYTDALPRAELVRATTATRVGLAVETAALVEDVPAPIHAHPTLSESLMEAAESLLG